MPTLRRKGRYWYLRDRSGGTDTEVATGCTDKKAAEAWQRQWERDRADPDGARRRAASETTTIQKALDLALARYKAENRQGNIADATLDYYSDKLAVLNAALGPSTLLSDVDAARVDAFIAKRREFNVSDHTISKELAVLEVALKLARRGGLWDGHPDDVMPERFSSRYQPRQRVLSMADVQKVVGYLAVKGPYGSYRRARPHRAAWVALAAGAGAELSALENAERGDWDEKAGIVHVRGTKNEHRDREVPVVLPVCRELVEFAWKHGRGTSPLLLDPWMKNWHELQVVARELEMEPFSLHTLRHSFATWHLAAGLSYDDVANALGHADTTMLHRVYGHLDGAQLRARFAGLLTSPDVPRHGAHGAHSAHSAHSPVTEKAPRKRLFGGGP